MSDPTTSAPMSGPPGWRIEAAFGAGRAQSRPLIVPFVTAGFPTMNATVPLVHALNDAGADLIEIGMPFSDPLADGPTIQRSSEVALANGMTVRRTLEIVRELRETGLRGSPIEFHGDPAADQEGMLRAYFHEVPVVLMGYSNPLYAYGLDRFLTDAVDAGVDGLIVADMPPEEAADYLDGCAANGLSTTFLVAPNAPDDRIRKVDEASTHFSYCVTVTGVTGARAEVQQRTISFLQRMRELAVKPFVVGFGVKAPEHVAALAPYADGVVIGSALIDAIDTAVQRIAADDSEAVERAAAETAMRFVGPLRLAAEKVAVSKTDGGGAHFE